MNYSQAVSEFGDGIKIPKIPGEGFLLSSDGIFFSLQGEGLSIGQPAVFIRLHLCNLACDFRARGGGICDTSYTWDTSRKEYWTTHNTLSFKETFDEIKKYPCKRVVFTGGEPLIQQSLIATFIRDYLPKEYIIEIETNGTILPSKELLNIPKKIIFNCSPKLSAAGMDKKDCIKPHVLRFFNFYNSSVFKFVVTKLEDLVEIEEIVKECDLLPDKIMIMPEGVEVSILTKRLQELAEEVKKRGWSLTPRLQIFIWGNKRRT
jgi:organic radical activating enzyme